MAQLKSWREVAIPHPDVLEGTFLQSEFAADLNAVCMGKATPEYQEATSFFQRTYITEGMRNLLVSVANRLAGKGGDPVLQLQTSFGGGKTHTMLAVYHLATRKESLADLYGLQQILDNSGIQDVPRARVAVIDGNSLSPGQARQHGAKKIKTLWGELAWQLGGDALYSLIAESDETGTSPGKDHLQKVLEQASPVVILVDELVAYIRQFEPGKNLPGGTYDSNLSFLQALTEAVKLVPNAVLLASLPESEAEAGSSRGLGVLKALEKTFGRVQALWKPVATEEAFEIVRRRLFSDIQDTTARDDTCTAFANMYLAENKKFPSETQEARYKNRMIQSYPIHPEVFDTLYEDWSTLQGFQRTRGVLKLMAKTIHRLWQDQNQDYLIMPGSFPLYDGSCRGELTQHLAQGWDPVVEKDIDGDRAETSELESKESRFGTVLAARRVARTVFLGTAPGSGELRNGIKGIDTAHILLGSVQAGQQSSIYTDALKRLSERLHYLNTSGDQDIDTSRYWFDTRANLRREMEDRKSRFDDKKEVRERIAKEIRTITNLASQFDGVHVFSSHADVPDDTALRLIVLLPSCHFNLQDTTIAFESVREYIKNNGNKPRHHANRLLFIAPDFLSYSRLAEQTRMALAWESIVDDIGSMRLNCDKQQELQARKAAQNASSVIPTTIRECYKWLLCPVQTDPTDKSIVIEHYSVPSSGSSYTQSIEQVCRDNELLIERWAAIHLQNILKKYYWKPESPTVPVQAVWNDFTKYLYLPRLRSIDTLYSAIQNGSASKDFFGLALGKDGESYPGFSFGKSMFTIDSEMILIDREESTRIEKKLLEEERKKKEQKDTERPITDGPTSDTSVDGNTPGTQGSAGISMPSVQPDTSSSVKTAFHGAVSISPSSFKIKLLEISDEVLQHLASDPQVQLDIRLEISASYPKGASVATQRTISENAKSIGFGVSEWE